MKASSNSALTRALAEVQTKNRQAPDGVGLFIVIDQRGGVKIKTFCH